MSKKKKREFDDDDGHTVIDMNIDGMPGYTTPEHRKNITEMQKLGISKKERRAIIFGSFLAAVPGIIITGLCLLISFVLVYLWLR